MNLECVVNVSEGRDPAVLDDLDAACGTTLLDRHSDPNHHRSVFTLAGPGAEVEAAARSLTERAVAALDITHHTGAHPRLGVVDVVPFVPLAFSPASGRLGQGKVVPIVRRPNRLVTTPSLDEAVAARNRFADWAATGLGLPCFLYGPLPPGGHRALPEIRRSAFRSLLPDVGPATPHPTGGACAVGARHFLVAYNIWIDGGDLSLARSVADGIRGPAVRSLAFDLAGRLQISCNLVDPLTIGPADVRDQVAGLLEPRGAGVAGCELVGLVPDAVLNAIPRTRWGELGLAESLTIEAKLEEAGVTPT